MKTQIPADPVSSNEKYLVWGLFTCFLLIILLALLPDTLFEWITTITQDTTPVLDG